MDIPTYITKLALGPKMSNVTNFVGLSVAAQHTPLPEGGTPEGEGVYLTVYPESSPNTDSLSF